MDFITWLPLDAGCNTIYTYVNKLTKIVKIIPCVVGDSGISAPATEKIFFYHIICSYGVPLVVLHDRDPRFMNTF